MDKPLVFIDLANPRAAGGREPLAKAGRSKSERQIPPRDRIGLHQIELPETPSAAEIVRRIQAEVKTVISRQHDGRIVFRVSNIPNTRKYVQVVVEFSKGSANLESTNSALDAVARFILSTHDVGKRIPDPIKESLTALKSLDFEQKELAVESTAAQSGFVLDRIPNVDAIEDHLRDDATGKLDARKVGALFAIKTPSIAKAAGISPQALNENPLSPRAQHVLKLFERVARLHLHPQFRKPADLRKWFRRPLPIFSNHSAEDLFKAGKLDVVATKVDEMLTGDFGG